MSGSVTGGTYTSFEVGDVDIDGGSTAGASVRFGKDSEAFPSFYLGVRLDGTLKEVDGTDSGATVDYESTELAIAPVLRWNIPVGTDPSVQPFVDVFFGYAYNWAEITRTAGAIVANDDDSGGGLWGGAGAGFELELSDDLGLQFGAEYILSSYSLAGIDIDEQRAQGYVGLVYTF